MNKSDLWNDSSLLITDLTGNQNVSKDASVMRQSIPMDKPNLKPIELGLPKLKFIKKRCEPVAKEMFDTTVYEDSPEEYEKRKKEYELKLKKEQEEQAQKLKAEQEAILAKKKQEEEILLKMKLQEEADARFRAQQAAEEARKKAAFEETAKKQLEQELEKARKKADVEAEEKRKLEEETKLSKQRAEEQLLATKRKLEEEERQKAKLLAELENIKQKALVESEARSKAERMADELKKQHEEDEARKRAEDEASAKKLAERAEKRKKLEEKKLAEEAARRRADEEELARIAAEEERLRLEEEERERELEKLRQEEEERKIAEEKEKRAREEAERLRKLAEEEEARLKAEEEKAKKKRAAWKMPVYEGDPEFDHANSVFAKFNTEQYEDIKKMLEMDFAYSKLDKVYPSDEDLQKSKKFILDGGYYFKVQNIFRYYQAQGDFPRVGYNEVANMFKETKVFDKNYPSSNLAVCFNGVNADKDKLDKELMRYEFVELIIRLAIGKYKQTGIAKRHREAIMKFMEEDFLPYAKSAESEYNELRFKAIWTKDIDNAIKKRRNKIDTFFKKIGGPDSACDIKEVTKMIRDAKLNQVSNREAIWCFAMSQQVCIDEKTGEGYTKLNLTEFYEFLVRVAIKQYEGKDMDVDDMISSLLDIVLK